MNAESAIALVVLAALCTSSLSQDDDAGAWYIRGLDLIGNNSPLEAVHACDRAIEIDPGFADAWKAKASALASSGRNDESLDAYDRAIELYDQTIASDPNSSGAWYEKGSALRDRAVVMHVMGKDSGDRAGCLEEAIRSLNRSLGIDSQGRLKALHFATWAGLRSPSNLSIGQRS